MRNIFFFIQYEPLQIRKNMTYEETLVKVLDRKEQELRTKKIPLVKVLWNNHGIEKTSWELEEEIQKKKEKKRIKFLVVNL
jgi:uncharacterized protein Smg (DUF494 family)